MIVWSPPNSSGLQPFFIIFAVCSFICLTATGKSNILNVMSPISATIKESNGEAPIKLKKGLLFSFKFLFIWKMWIESSCAYINLINCNEYFFTIFQRYIFTNCQFSCSYYNIDPCLPTATKQRINMKYNRIPGWDDGMGCLEGYGG